MRPLLSEAEHNSKMFLIANRKAIAEHEERELAALRPRLEHWGAVAAATARLALWAATVAGARAARWREARQTFLRRRFVQRCREVMHRRRKARRGRGWAVWRGYFLVIRVWLRIARRRRAVETLRAVLEQFAATPVAQGKCLRAAARRLQAHMRRFQLHRMVKLQFLILQVERWELGAVARTRDRKRAHYVVAPHAKVAKVQTGRVKKAKAPDAGGAAAPPPVNPTVALAAGAGPMTAKVQAVQQFLRKGRAGKGPGRALPGKFYATPSQYPENYDRRQFRCPYFLVTYNVCLTWYLQQRAHLMVANREYLQVRLTLCLDVILTVTLTLLLTLVPPSASPHVQLHSVSRAVHKGCTAPCSIVAAY